MSTTALVVEFLIIGLQAAIFSVIISCSIFGIEWLNLDLVTKFQAPTLILLIVPFFYPIGLFVDYLAEHSLEYCKKTIRSRYPKAKSGFELLLLCEDEWLRRYCEYQRLKIRISRSSFLMFLIITIFFFLLPIIKINLSLELTKITMRLSLAGWIAGSLLTVLAMWSWEKSTESFYSRIEEAYKILPKRQLWK